MANTPDTRTVWYTRYRVFEEFALKDQRRYYQARQRLYHKAASQVNILRALAAFLTGLSAAAAGLIVTYFLAPGALNNDGACYILSQDQTIVERMAVIDPDFEMPPAPELDERTTETPEQREARLAALEGECEGWRRLARVFMVLAVVAPALGGAFTSLADLYQWDRLTGIYEGAEENLEVADAQSPLDGMENDTLYTASVRATVEGTLDVMNDETAQWGQSIRTPRQVDEFLKDVLPDNGENEPPPQTP
jgi:hypothetical protein